MRDEKEDNLFSGVLPGVLANDKGNTPPRPEENPVLLAFLKILDERTHALVPRQEFEKDIKHVEERISGHENSGHDKYVTQQQVHDKITAVEAKCATQQQVQDKIALSESKYADATTLKWVVGLGLPLVIGLASWYVSNLVSSMKDDLAKAESRLQTSISERTTEDKVRLIVEKRIAEENDKRKR
jgi:hypothetical protein